MNIKLVAVDMDGTLLNSKKKCGRIYSVGKSHPEIKTVIASGRQYYTLERDFLPIRDNLAFIAENGGLVFEKGEIIFKDEIDKQDVLKCLDIIDKSTVCNTCYLRCEVCLHNKKKMWMKSTIM